MRKIYKSALICLLIGASSIGYMYYSVARIKSVDSIRTSIRVDQPGIHQFDFAPMMSARYKLMILTEHMPNLTTHRCLLTNYRKATECENIKRKLHVSWRILNGGQLVSEGIAQGKPNEHGVDVMNEHIGLLLAYFEASRGETYQVEIDIKQPEPQLAQHNPQLSVDLTAMEYKDAVVASAMLYVAGWFFAVVAVTLALFGFISGLRRKSKVY